MADPTSLPLTRASVLSAHTLIAPYIHHTPILTSTHLTLLASTPRTPASLSTTPWAGKPPAKPILRLWFKCENLQRIGAFKARGAFHALLRLTQEPGWVESGGRERGVVTHSSGTLPSPVVVRGARRLTQTGNHAQALALAAATMGIPAHVVMPTISTPTKIAATRGYGANVVFSGPTAAEREAVVVEVVARTGARVVPPYDHPHVMLGQGTAGVEMVEQVLVAGGRGLDAVIVPCGGGGLLSGTAVGMGGTGVRVFGAEPGFEGADDCRRGLERGERVEVVRSGTVADGLRTPVGVWPWRVIREKGMVRGVFSVTEEEIKRTLRLVWERMKVVVEPSAVVGLAVALWNEDFRRLVEEEAGEEGWDLGIIFTGGNVSLEALAKLFSEEASSEEAS